jgi:DNA ligase (NAD+)
MNTNVKEEIDFIKNQILKHNDLYYKQNKPVISDKQYDELFERLQKLENENPEYKYLDSPTNRVGSDLLNDFKEVDHSIPMLSLANTYNEKDIDSFVKRVKNGLSANPFVVNEPSYVCEFKFDGASVELIYREGRLFQALTRDRKSVV